VQFVVDGVNFGSPVMLTASGSNGVASSRSIATLNVGGSPHIVTANYTATSNFANSSGSLAGGQAVTKASAMIVVTPYSVTYDSAAHTASGTATGVNGESLSGLDLSSTTHTDAGTYTDDAWTFTDVTGNYSDASGKITDSIGKATATVSVNGYTGVYDATAHGATGTATGVGGVDLNAQLKLGATFTDVPGGTAHWTFTGGTNYNDESGDAAIVITKAKATVTVNGYTGVYDAAAHGATGSATGIGGTPVSGLNLGASFTNVPGGQAHWTFTDATGNYNDESGDAAIVITKAKATVTVNGYTGVYDAAAHGATGSATGIGGTPLSGLNLGASFTNVPGGQAHWTFTDATGNYNDESGDAAIVITKANATVSVSGYEGLYDGTAHGATGTATGVKGEDLTSLLTLGEQFINVPGGTANWSFSGGQNYKPQSGFVKIAIYYRWDGFLQPINDTAHQLVAMSKFKLGQTIPAKFVLKNAAGAVVQQTGNPSFRSATLGVGACDAISVPDNVEPASADIGTQYTWDGAQYHYNWSTKGLTAGLYRIFAYLADGTTPSVDICLTK
jgi:hypothetical protein